MAVIESHFFTSVVETQFEEPSFHFNHFYIFVFQVALGSAKRGKKESSINGGFLFGNF